MVSRKYAGLLLACMVVPCSSFAMDKGAHSKPSQAQKPTTQKPPSQSEEFQAINAFAQLIIGLGQIFYKPSDGAIQQGVQNVASAAANFYQLTQKYGIYGDDASQITRSLMDSMDESERSQLVENILKALTEIRTIIAEQ